MGANGKYKVDIGELALFTDSGKLAVDTAMMFRSAGYEATAWQKDHSGWEMISPQKPK